MANDQSRFKPTFPGEKITVQPRAAPKHTSARFAAILAQWAAMTRAREILTLSHHGSLPEELRLIQPYVNAVDGG
jgi:hypothetical protein